MPHPSSRNTINLEDAQVLTREEFPGDQYLLRLHAPLTAKDAQPGSFIHLRCDPGLPMRRPMSIMRTHPASGWIDILYKVHGHGTRLLASRRPGETMSLLGPVGTPFRLHSYRKRPLLLGGGIGIPPMIFLAEHIKNNHKSVMPLLMAGSEVPFPFNAVPSQIMLEGIPHGVIATMPLLEDWKIPCRLASLQGFPGCHDGLVTDLAREWLQSLPGKTRDEVEIFSCGPPAMLKAVAGLAHEFALPCQVSLEEHMACAVGGCAGCNVPVYTDSGMEMKRVCVDGPVFEAAAVFPQPE